MINNAKKGIIFAIVTAGISGLSIFYNKQIAITSIDPLIFNIIKNGGVAFFLTIILFSTKKLHSITHLTAKQWTKLASIAVVGGSIPFILYFEGLRSVSAINANIIHKSLFVWVALLALPVLGERLSVLQIAGYALVAVSNLFLGGFGGFTGSRGEFLIMTATLLWALENIIAKLVLADTESVVAAWARMFFGTWILVGVALFWGKIHLMFSVAPTLLIAIAGSIVLLTAYVVSWYKALKLAPATVVASVLILATPVTNVLTAAAITHTFPIQHVLNLAGTLVGLALVARLTRIFPIKKQPAAPA